MITKNSALDSAESFDPESFDPELMTEGLMTEGLTAEGLSRIETSNQKPVAMRLKPEN